MIDDLRLTIDDSKKNDECPIHVFNRQSSIVNRQSERIRHLSLSRHSVAVALALLLLTMSTQTLGLSEEMDRVLAAVNGKVITESDLRIARDLNSLLVFGNDAQVGEASRQEQISRLIDLELIRQELTSFPLDPEQQSGIDARVEELKAGYAEIGGLEPLLRRIGLQAAELQEYLRLQASILRFVNMRFRPFVTVSPDDVSAYYRDRLAPKLKGAGIPVPPVEQVSSKIEDLLKEEKVNSALDDWIKELRTHSRIELLATQSASDSQTMCGRTSRSVQVASWQGPSSEPVSIADQPFKIFNLRIYCSPDGRGRPSAHEVMECAGGSAWLA